MALGCNFLVERGDLHHTSVHPATISDDTVPPSGGLLLAIERFGFSANTITYAVFGDAMGYWSFFPAPDGWGRVPVWGFARVLRSATDGITEGDRFFGYLPPSTHLLVRAGEVSGDGFTDVTEHRMALPPVYNRYVNCATDPSYDPRYEDLQMLLRPLFMTSFLLDDQLADEGFHGADAVVLTSASSKTAFALAHLISRRGGDRPAVVGLTSASNVGFVEGLGCYDRVVTYDGVLDGSTPLPADPTALVDFSGDPLIVGAVHRQVGDALAYSGIVGGTHWQAIGGAEPDTSGEPLPGAARTFFFAPDRVDQRRADWGPDGMEERIAAAWGPFVERVSGWVTVVRGAGPDAVRRVYEETLRGDTSPDIAHVLSMYGTDRNHLED